MRNDSYTLTEKDFEELAELGKNIYYSLERGLDGTDANDKEAQPSIRGMVNGSADRLDRPSANDRVNRLKALGNGIVPQSLAEFLRRVEG